MLGLPRPQGACDLGKCGILTCRLCGPRCVGDPVQLPPSRAFTHPFQGLNGNPAGFPKSSGKTGRWEEGRGEMERGWDRETPGAAARSRGQAGGAGTQWMRCRGWDWAWERLSVWEDGLWGLLTRPLKMKMRVQVRPGCFQQPHSEPGDETRGDDSADVKALKTGNG